MNYIWEVALKKKDIFLKQAKIFSPYYEVSPEYLYMETLKEQAVEFNSLYRFEKIFSPLFMEGITEDEWQTYFFDVCMHLLIEEDLKSGYTTKEYQVRKIMEDIKKGEYGAKNRELYAKLSLVNKHTLATYLDNQMRTGASQTLFAKVLIELLQTGIIYKNRINTKELMLYIGEKKKDETLDIITLTENFFLPLDVTVRIFWDTHFAIMDEEQTMIYERLEIY